MGEDSGNEYNTECSSQELGSWVRVSTGRAAHVKEANLLTALGLASCGFFQLHRGRCAHGFSVGVFTPVWVFPILCTLSVVTVIMVQYKDEGQRTV